MKIFCYKKINFFANSPGQTECEIYTKFMYISLTDIVSLSLFIFLYFLQLSRRKCCIFIERKSSVSILIIWTKLLSSHFTLKFVWRLSQNFFCPDSNEMLRILQYVSSYSLRSNFSIQHFYFCHITFMNM